MSPMKTPPTAAMLEEATLSLAQAARRLKLTQSELRSRLGSGEIPFVEVAGKLRVPILGLQIAAKNQTAAPAEPRSARSKPIRKKQRR